MNTNRRKVLPLVLSGEFALCTFFAIPASASQVAEDPTPVAAHDEHPYVVTPQAPVAAHDEHPYVVTPQAPVAAHDEHPYVVTPQAPVAAHDEHPYVLAS
jgi:hypothetical protein